MAQPSLMPAYRRTSQNSTGTPMPYAYTSPTAVLSNAKSYSTGFDER